MKCKSKSNLKTKTRREEKWTAKAWYDVETILSNIAFSSPLTKKQRTIFYHLAELAGETADRLSGVTPEIWAETCRKEDEAFAARLRGEAVKLPSELAQEKREAKRANYSVRNRPKKQAPKTTANKKARASQLEMELA